MKESALLRGRGTLFFWKRLCCDWVPLQIALKKKNLLTIRERESSCFFRAVKELDSFDQDFSMYIYCIYLCNTRNEITEFCVF